VGVLALLLGVACDSRPDRALDDEGVVPELDSGDDDGGSSGPDAPPATSSTDESGDASSTGSPTEPGSQIAVIAMPADWSIGPNGTWTFPATEPSPFVALGQAFYAEHPDEYDFLAVYTEGLLIDFWALAVTVHYDIGGIGLSTGDAWIEPADAGSAGRLQQINVMNDPGQYAPDPANADVLVHETAHRWAAFIELTSTPAPAYLLDAGWSHWNIHVHGGGPSATGYGDVVDLGGGRYRYDEVRPWKLSPLELYLAGLMPEAEVPPMFYVADPYDHDPAVTRYGETVGIATLGEPCSFSGTRVDFDIGDVVAANGPRTPAFGAAPTEFRVAFVLACVDLDACDPADLAIVEAQRTAFPATWSAATGGRSTVTTDL